MRKRVNITLNDTTYDKIKALAEADRRSISNKIECILEDYVGNKKSTTPALSYPPGVRGIPEKSYTVTADATAGYAEPITTTSTSTPVYTSNRTDDGYKKHPALWLKENNIDPMDTSMRMFKVFKEFFPDVSVEEFDKYQQERRAIHQPDPTDPYDPMTNNPYNRRKSVIG